MAPGWFGPKCLRGFAASPPRARADAVRGARGGTTTESYGAWLRHRIAPGLLRVREERVASIRRRGAGWKVEGTRVHGPYASVYEATGYDVDVGNVPWLACHVGETVAGLPVLDRALQAAPGLHLLGALAELELGPAGRNLWGAMRAVDRLTAHLAG